MTRRACIGLGLPAKAQVHGPLQHVAQALALRRLHPTPDVLVMGHACQTAHTLAAGIDKADIELFDRPGLAGEGGLGRGLGRVLGNGP